MLAAPVARGKIIAEVQGVVLGPSCPEPTAAQKIVHDTEYYILEAQTSERWTAEDAERCCQANAVEVC